MTTTAVTALRSWQKGEAVLLEYGLGSGRAQKCQVAGCLGLCGHGRSNRVDDCWMGIGGKSSNDLDAWLDLGVSCVDDAKRRFSTRHQCKRGAHIFRHREFWSGGLPRPEFFQRRLGVFPDRHRLHVAGGNAPVARKLREIKAWSDRDIVELGMLRRDQDKPVTQ